ncbi:28095_t:CDS:2, partial [Gigaspora margarita]
QQIEDGDYKILQFWADIARPHTENNNTDILSNVQTAIYSCTDKTQLLTTINYLKNISEAQIKEILLRAKIQKKEQIIESYINLPANAKPLWFFKKLKDLGKIKEKLLELPITDPFYCFIPIYQRNAISRIENDCLLKFSTEQYNDINTTMDIVFETYNPVLEPSPQIELKSDLEDLHKNYYGLLQYFHLHGPEHPAKCIIERKRWHHQAPYGLSSSAFNQVTEGIITSDEITNKGNETNCLQPIGNSKSYYYEYVFILGKLILQSLIHTKDTHYIS